MRDAYELLGLGKIFNNREVEELIMKRFDRDRDGVLTYTDICDVFRPRDMDLAREFGQRMPMELQTSSMISAKASRLIKKLFTAFVKVETHIENMKKHLIKRP